MDFLCVMGFCWCYCSSGSYVPLRNFESGQVSKKIFCRIFWGIGYENNESKLPIAADYWLGFVLGSIELLSYPILFLSDNSAFVGAWLAFKTANRGMRQKESRTPQPGIMSFEVVRC